MKHSTAENSTSEETIRLRVLHQESLSRGFTILGIIRVSTAEVRHGYGDEPNRQDRNP
jgi:hypothetical protein